jgi:phthiodiolone/phenolphthiodiolone dimycocerosates ketoreductase
VTRLAVGIGVPTRPPLALTRWMVRWARLWRLDSVWTIDHFLGFVPQALWDDDFSFLARRVQGPDAIFEYQTLLGYLARRVGGMQLAVGVTEPVRRHPVLIAQAFLTLSHMTKTAPILGIGPGERENTEPYGLDFSRPVGRLEEALQVIRLCFASQGPFDYQGSFFRLEQAVMDLQPAAGRTPQIWLAAHGPRMLRLTGQHGDGWYPTHYMTPAEYTDKLAVIRRAAAEAGREPGAITPGLALPMLVAPTEKEARSLLDTRPVRFGALLIPASVWSAEGFKHPLGERFRGLVDFVPQHYDRSALDLAIAAVPPQLLERRVAWGTPERLVAYLRQLQEAGLRHAVLGAVSGVLSPRLLVYGLLATARMAVRLRRGTRRENSG